MNLRTLKKLSKCAAPLLVVLGDRREQFPAKKGDNHLGHLITARKHWDRWNFVQPTCKAHNGFLDRRGMSIVHTTRKGRTVLIKPPSEPRKGTIMVGGTDGGEQPEWSEETAWSALHSLVACHFTDWEAYVNSDGPWVCSRDLSSSRKVLAAAREIVAEALVRRAA